MLIWVIDSCLLKSGPGNQNMSVRRIYSPLPPARLIVTLLPTLLLPLITPPIQRDYESVHEYHDAPDELLLPN